MNDIFSKCQDGFQKGFNVQQCLIAVTVKCKRALDKGSKLSALLKYLSKKFGCLPFDLTTGELGVYDFEENTIYAYLRILQKTELR